MSKKEKKERKERVAAACAMGESASFMIDSILADEPRDAKDAFAYAMSEKLTARLDAMKVEIASGL